MPIDWDPGSRQFHLRNERISYVIRVLENGVARRSCSSVPALAPGRSYGHLGLGPFHGFSNRVGDPVALEYPTSGAGDFRVPALVVETADGSTVLDLALRRPSDRRRASRRLPGLPSTYVEADEEADTVEIDLVDEPSGRRGHPPLHDLPRSARRRPERDPPERGHDAAPRDAAP